MYNQKINFGKIVIKKETLIAFIIFIICLILYLPREWQIYGADTFEILWMATAIKNGMFINAENTWLLNFFSVLGFYPFSHYPIGIPSLLALFLSIGLSVELSYFLLSIITLVIVFTGARKFSSYFFKRKVYQYFFVLAFITTPLFLGLNYMNVHPRTFFLGFLLWFLYYLFRSIDTPNFSNITFLVLFFILMLFTHRLWVGVSIFVLFALISKLVVNKIYKMKMKKNIALFIVIIIITLYIFLFFIGKQLFRIDDRKITSPWLTNDTLLGFLINLVLDFATRIGLLIFLVPFGIYLILKETFTTINISSPSNLSQFKLKNYLFVLLIMSMVSFSLVFTLYSTVLFLPILILFSTFGLQYLINRFKFKNANTIGIIVVLSSSFLSFLYLTILSVNIFWLDILILLSVLFSLFLLVTHLFLSNKAKFPNFIIRIFKKMNKQSILYKSNKIIYLISIILFSVTVQAGQIRHSDLLFPALFISNEEKNAISKIKELGISGFIFASHEAVAMHINGYGFLPVLGAPNRPQQVYYNMINSSIVDKYTRFNFSKIFSDATFFELSISLVVDIYSNATNINVTSFNGHFDLAFYKIQYCLALKENGRVLPYTINRYGETNSLLIESSINLPPVFESEHLILWKYY